MSSVDDQAKLDAAVAFVRHALRCDPSDRFTDSLGAVDLLAVLVAAGSVSELSVLRKAEWLRALGARRTCGLSRLSR